MPAILVIDDEASIQHAFRRAFRDSGLALEFANTGADAMRKLETEVPDTIVLDIHLPDAKGLELFHRIRAVDARIPIILITGHGTTELAIEAMKEGAFEFLLKPVELRQLRDLVDQALRSSRLMRVPAALAEVEPAPTTGDLLIGRGPAMQEIYKSIGRVARQDVTVLIIGESGTGKELVARAIYQHGNRAEKPFLAINCAAITETLLESELFGHERGAFTGAERKRIGKFEQCHGGTIFLDEVGEMTPLTQAKVLRLIQEQKFERVGGEDTITTDVRLIAATNADLEKLIEEGKFRKDLYFRLNVFSIRLPPLRDRGDDLVLLVDHFVARFSQELKITPPAVAPETIEALREYSWPGNVRELQSVLKQSLLKMRGSLLLPEFLPSHLTHGPGGNGTSVPQATPDASSFQWDTFVNARIADNTDNLYAECLELMEREVIVRVLRHTQGNQLQAARILGITRGSLRSKVRALKITVAKTVWSEDDHLDP